MEPGRLADSYGGYRARLIEHLRAAGVEDLAVLRAFGETPRHLFVPEALRRRAYEDIALPIGSGQTISQPSTQALHLQALHLMGHEKVLEIGTGSGYQTALLTRLASQVVSIERIPTLAALARRNLAEAGAAAVTILVGDGSLGWLPLAPYDAILVAAAGPTVPEPLTKQLAESGRLVMPVLRGGQQEVVLWTKEGSQMSEVPLGTAQFVPLVGRHGFQDESPKTKETEC